MASTADAVVIGAGVIGSSVACELARTGRRVTVVDKLNDVAAGSTGFSSAVVRFHYSTWDGVVASWESKFGWENWRRHVRAPGSDEVASFVRTGIVVLDSPRLRMERTVPFLDRLRIPCERWSSDDIRTRVPALDPGVFGPPKGVDSPEFLADPDGELGAYYMPRQSHERQRLAHARRSPSMKTCSGLGFGSRRRHVVAGALAAVTVTMTACGGSTSESAPTPSGGEIPEFVFATQGTIGSLDLTKDFGAFGPVALINEQLERSRSDGSFTPGLAASVTETATSLVYHLRPGSTFTDGKPVTVADVVFSVERARAAGAQTASYLTSIEKAEATGDNDVTVTLSRPDPAVRALLAGSVAVVQKAYVEAHPENYGSSSALPVGSGPYAVGSFSPEQIVLNRNEGYRGEKPKIKQLTIRLLKDDDTTQLAMRSGDVDSTILIDVGNARRYQSIEGTTLVPISGNSISYLSLDTGQAPLSDRHVRKAIAYAIDRKPLFDTLFAGYWRNLEGFMTPAQLASVSSPAEAESFLKSLPQYPFDMERAKSELARSRYPDGFDLTVKVSPTFAWSEKLLLSLKQNLKPLGVGIEVKVVDPKAYVAEVYAHKDLGIKPLELGALTPDAAYVLKLVVGSSTAVRNGLNTANFASADVDAAITTLTSSPDRGRRFEAAKRLLGRIAEEVPYIPLFNQQTVRVMGRGFVYDAAVADQNDYANGSWIYKISAAS